MRFSLPTVLALVLFAGVSTAYARGEIQVVARAQMEIQNAQGSFSSAKQVEISRTQKNGSPKFDEFVLSIDGVIERLPVTQSVNLASALGGGYVQFEAENRRLQVRILQSVDRQTGAFSWDVELERIGASRAGALKMTAMVESVLPDLIIVRAN